MSHKNRSYVPVPAATTAAVQLSAIELPALLNMRPNTCDNRSVYGEADDEGAADQRNVSGFHAELT